MQKHTWHGELIYSMKQSQGCMKSEDNTWKEQYGRSMGGYVMDHGTTRKWETIRHNKSESYGTKYLEAGSKDSVWNAVRRFRKCRNHRNGVECAKMCEVSGIALLRLGSNISARIMSAKMEWVLQNVTVHPVGSSTSFHVPNLSCWSISIFMACFHIGQSGQLSASFKFSGSVTISHVTIACSRVLLM